MIMSTVYAAAKPEVATSAAPISGPRTKALLQAVVVSTFAAGNIEDFSKRGMIAVRAGLLIANAADCRATRM